MKKLLTSAAAVFLFACAYFITNSVQDYTKDYLKVNNIPNEVMQSGKEGLAPYRHISAFVTKVTDGDTIEVSYKEKKYKVRLLYVDTPESVKPGVKVQTYSKEASSFVKDTVLHKQVKLVFEKGLRDRYNRLLAHVMLKDGEYLNALLVRNGYARVEVVKPNNTCSSYFYKLQESAVHDKKGFWGLPEERRPFIKDSKGNYIPVYMYEKEAAFKKGKYQYWYLQITA